MALVILRPHPFREGRTTTEVPAGTSLAEALRLAGLPNSSPAVACVDGTPIPPSRWESELLGPESQVAAAAVAGYEIAIFVLYAVIAAVVGFAVGRALAYIWPGSEPDFDFGSGPKRRPLITGASNELRPFGKLPKVRGRARYYPQLAALPYSEWEGKVQFYHLLFSFGKGPLSLDDHRIGNAPLDAFSDIEYRVRPGWPTDDPVALYEDQVLEEGVHAQLVYESDDDPPVRSGWTTRVTDHGVTKIGVDVQFPQGLGLWSDKGNKEGIEVKVAIEYQAVSANPADDAAWTKVSWRDEVDTGKSYSSPLTLKRKEPGEPFVYGLSWAVTAGQYRVRMRRETQDTPAAMKFSDTWWSVLRSFRPGDPVLLEGVCTVEMRIRATGQLNGIIQNYSARATSIVPYWNEDTSAWVVPTASSPAPTEPWQYAAPASHFRHTLEARKVPIPSSRIDLATLAVWAEETRARGLYYNRADEDDLTVFERLRVITMAGRASYSMRDGKHSVAMDIEAQSTPIQHFTPRNTFDYLGERIFDGDLHALKVKYTDGEGANPTWKLVDVTVFDDGYSKTGEVAWTVPATAYGEATLEWCTSRDAAWRHGRYRLASRRLRRELHHFSADVQHLVCNRGDLVIFGSEMLDGTPVWGRVKSVALDGSGNATAVTVDEKLLVDGAKNYRFRFVLGTSTTPVDANVLNPGAGERVTFTFDPAIPAASPKPVAGNLFLFGERTVDWRRCIITSIEPEADFRARLTAVDEASGVYTADVGNIPGGGSGSFGPPPKNDETDTDNKGKVKASPKSAASGGDGAGIRVTLEPGNKSKNANVSRQAT